MNKRLWRIPPDAGEYDQQNGCRPCEGVSTICKVESANDVVARVAQNNRKSRCMDPLEIDGCWCKPDDPAIQASVMGTAVLEGKDTLFEVFRMERFWTGRTAPENLRTCSKIGSALAEHFFSEKSDQNESSGERSPVGDQNI